MSKKPEHHKGRMLRTHFRSSANTLGAVEDRRVDFSKGVNECVSPRVQGRKMTGMLGTEEYERDNKGEKKDLRKRSGGSNFKVLTVSDLTQYQNKLCYDLIAPHRSGHCLALPLFFCPHY